MPDLFHKSPSPPLSPSVGAAPDAAAEDASMQSFGGLLKAVWRGFGLSLRERWPVMLGVLGAALLVAWLMVWPMDRYWGYLVRGSGRPGPALSAVAEWVGSAGDVLQFNVVIFLVLWIGGRRAGPVHRRANWRKAAMAGLIAMSVSGMACNVMRPLSGRPRPSTLERVDGVVDGFALGRGFQLGNRYQSFPSGHTTTAFASAVPVLWACPPLGVVCVAGAGAMGWARIVQGSHHPSDILIGAVFGSLAGWGAVRGVVRGGGRGARGNRKDG